MISYYNFCSTFLCSFFLNFERVFSALKVNHQLFFFTWTGLSWKYLNVISADDHLSHYQFWESKRLTGFECQRSMRFLGFIFRRANRNILRWCLCLELHAENDEVIFVSRSFLRKKGFDGCCKCDIFCQQSLKWLRLSYLSFHRQLLSEILHREGGSTELLGGQQFAVSRLRLRSRARFFAISLQNRT